MNVLVGNDRPYLDFWAKTTWLILKLGTKTAKFINIFFLAIVIALYDFFAP